MKRICYTLLPEVTQNQELKREVTTLITQDYNSIPPRVVNRNNQLLSYELLLLIFLTMIGFTFPVQQPYNPAGDNHKTWCRELMVRVCKVHAPQNMKGYRYFTPIENYTAKFLQFKYPELCRYDLQTRISSLNLFDFMIQAKVRVEISLNLH